MDELTSLAGRRPAGGFGGKALLADDREWVLCFTCRKKHPLRAGNATQDYLDFCERHKVGDGCVCLRVGPEQLERVLGREQRRRKKSRLAQRHFSDNASILEAFQTGQTLDLTGVGIATSVTAGWCSNWIDNSTNLYLDVYFWYYSQAVNTASSSQKAHYLYAPGSYASADLPSNTAGNTATNSASTSATLTYLDITANTTGWPLVQVVPYVTTNKALQAGLFGVAKGHDGACPLFVWLGVVNAAGPTIGTGGSPATAVKFRGSYLTAS